MTKRVALMGLALLGACDCGASHLADAGFDAGEDARANDSEGDAGPDAGSLPPVTPASPSCDELDVPDDRACIEHGWFAMARWSTMTFYNGGTGVVGLPRPRQSVFLETFLMDRTEVTVKEYRSYLAASDAEPPPERCGYDNRHPAPTADTREWVPEVSGMVDARAEHPVVCVTRAEAAAFCEWRDGGLPTVAQWMRAGQEPYPAFRRFPWGDSPPPPEDAAAWISTHFREYRRDYLVSDRWDGLDTAAAGSRDLGAGPSGVLDLGGNASELLADCLESLETTYGIDAMPAVRPSAPFESSCTEAVLVGGENWASYNYIDLIGTQTIWAMRDGEEGFAAAGGTSTAPPVGTATEQIWGENRLVDGGTDTSAEGPGNERRSWRIGFRCVYAP